MNRKIEPNNNCPCIDHYYDDTTSDDCKSINIYINII